MSFCGWEGHQSTHILIEFSLFSSTYIGQLETSDEVETEYSNLLLDCKKSVSGELDSPFLQYSFLGIRHAADCTACLKYFQATCTPYAMHFYGFIDFSFAVHHNIPDRKAQHQNSEEYSNLQSPAPAGCAKPGFSLERWQTLVHCG